MLCNYNANLTYSYRIQEKYLDIKNLNKIDNLPFKCASSVEKLESNIGFWSHFILTIIIIASGTIYSIIHYYQTYYKNNTKSNFFTKDLYIESSINIKEITQNVFENKFEVETLRVKTNKIENNIINNDIKNDKTNSINDESKKEDSSISSNENNESSKNHPFDNYFEEAFKKEETPKEEVIEGIKLEHENEEPFKKILIRNIIEHYPFMTFFYTSFINPLFINICLFTFNIILIFCGNAIFYFENIIEKRIFDNNRSSFIYPLSKEIVKMLLSIIFSMAFMLIIRAITLIPRIKKKKLLEYIRSHSYEENKNIIILKNFYMRRMISCIVMLCASIFFLYYIIVFCSMYKQTQLNWFISGVWCILFEWILLAPLYILIISIVEKKEKCDNMISYYMKQLFMF